MPAAWTADTAQTALGMIALHLARLIRDLEEIHAGLPEPADINDRQEGRKPYDTATEVFATIECVLEDHLRPAFVALERSSQVTDAELAEEYREWLKRERQWRRGAR